ncbi:helix-turn-helix domain-containing protein [Elioraea rosea]|uniref:helix-turn-helix domain-containing protein n=1 Tax=Elioraea rosea TaxID=2492390 RepID=UPI0013152B01|nr:RodZ domain-containing protein [Elioraea rosea]
MPAASPSAVGGLLRAARQRHGLSVQDVAVALRIRRPYLDAIEDGRVSALPAPAYAIGFVKTYAAALGLDQEEIARRWRDETGNAAARRPELSFPAPVPERGIPAGALIVVGVILAAGIYGGWYYLSGTGQRVADIVPPLPERLARIDTAPAPQASPQQAPAPLTQTGPVAALPGLAPSAPPSQPAPVVAPSFGEASSGQQATVPLAPMPEPPRVMLPPTGAWPTGPAVTPESLLPPRPATPNPTSANAATVATAPAAPPAEPPPPPAQSFGGSDDSRVVLRARADSWIQVRERSGGTVLFNRVLRPGETYRVPMRSGLLLTTGNAGGLEVVLDGDALPTLGQQGVVRRDLPLEPEALRQAVAALPR